MIKSFKSKLAENVFDDISSKYSRKLPNELLEIAIRKLDQLNAVTRLKDLNVPPNNKLKKLKGNLDDFWSIRINNQYRIIFRWLDKDAYEVDIIDYH